MAAICRAYPHDDFIMLKTTIAAGCLFLAGITQMFSAKAESAPSSTEILRWHDGKKAVCLLYFDDSLPSHIQTVIPELKKRGMAGTFYLNPGTPQYKKQAEAWEKTAPGPGIEYGNHTFTHSGAMSLAQFDEELEKTTEAINRAYPNRKQPRLISFAMPGVPPEKWGISEAERNQAVEKHHLVMRPGYVSLKPGAFGPGGTVFGTKEEIDKVCGLVDAAIAKGEMVAFLFHGVGGEWLTSSPESFMAILDKLDACREQLWVTDPISWYQYDTERKTAKVQTLPSDNGQLRFQLSCQSDPVFYDLPLTLLTQVPPQWKQCEIIQGDTQIKLPVVDGAVRYQAIPGAKEIIIRAVDN